MIENIRKYTGLIIVVIVLLLLGFIFMDTRNFFNRSVGGGATVVTIDGVGYNQSDLTARGSAPFRLAMALRSYDASGLEIVGFASTLAGDAEDPGNTEIQFFASRLILQQAAEDFGIHPSDAEVEKFIKTLSAFSENPPPGAAPGTQGEFSQEKYNAFAEKELRYRGLSESDFRDLVRDILAYRELRKIIGGGLAGSRHEAEAMAVVNAQKIALDEASIDIAKLKAGIKPSDEDLKAYWEPLKEAFKTEQRIKVTYGILSPKYPEALAGDPAKPADNETDEQRKVRDAAEAERQEARKKIEKALSESVGQFNDRLDESEGKDFDKLAEAEGWELQTTDWVTRNTLPDDLKTPTRGISSSKTISDELFDLTLGPDPLDPFPLPLPVGDNQWFIGRLDALEESREKTFEEAKEEVTKRYVAEKADEAAKKEVEEKLAAMKKDVEAGKTFAEAAQAQGLEAKSIGPFAVSEPVPEEPAARQVFMQAATTPPGEFSDPLYLEDRALILHVTERQIVKDDNRGTQIDNYASRLETQNENAAFSAWLRDRIQEAGVSTTQG
ncbi:hypothetical protein [Haloferula sargassicola]|uniref:PpiC domain-containing protein n=1 Tax=Haloferula sargassicola TaxID=490096 RepID=A0ABP9UM42_9BACT